jgi:protein-disulfide isomerase
MSQKHSTGTFLAAGLAAIVSGSFVYAVLTLWQPISEGPRFEMAIHDYLIEHPEVLIEMQQILVARQGSEQQVARQQALDSIGVDALLDPAIAYVEGPDDASVTVVEFFDYRCGFCKASLPAVKSALAADTDVKFAFVEYPILTEDSLVAARAAVAARRQPGMYLPLHLALMETQGDLPLERILSIAETVGIDIGQLQNDMEDPVILENIDAAHALAQELFVNGTPTFVINGEFVVGQISEEELASHIEANQS